MAREIYPNHLPLPSPHQVSPSSAKPGNLMLKESEATGLGKTWKQGMKKGVASATNLTNPLLRACLPFFFFFLQVGSAEGNKILKETSCSHLRLKLSVLLHLPTGPCSPIKAFSSGH